MLISALMSLFLCVQDDQEQDQPGVEVNVLV